MIVQNGPLQFKIARSVALLLSVILLQVASSIASEGVTELKGMSEVEHPAEIAKFCLHDGYLHGLWCLCNSDKPKLSGFLYHCFMSLSADDAIALKTERLVHFMRGHDWTMADSKFVHISDISGLMCTIDGVAIALVKGPWVTPFESGNPDLNGSFVKYDEIRLTPIEKVLFWERSKSAAVKDNRCSNVYDSFLLHSGQLSIWFYQGTVLCGYRHVPEDKDEDKDEEKEASKHTNPEHIKEQQTPVKLPEGLSAKYHEWELIGVYSVEIMGGFSVVYGKTPLLLTAGGEVYRLKDKKAERIMSVWPASEDNKTSKTTDAESSTMPRRLLLLEDQDNKKYVLFQWAGEELTPLDVQNKEKQNIEPFLPAKDVNPKIIKAATVMLKQMEKDEQEVAEFRKELEAKKKAQAEEDAKKPKSQTLQERLQQN